MMKTKIALALVLMAFALTPADATSKESDSAAKTVKTVKKNKSGKTAGKHDKASDKATTSKSHKEGKAGKTGKAHKHRATARANKEDIADKTVKAGKHKAGKTGKDDQAEKVAKLVPQAAPAKAPVAERKQARAFDTLTIGFLNALWLIDPDSAIAAGKYDGAANMAVPDAPSRARQLAFTDEWLQKFAEIDQRQLSVKQRTDLALLISKLNADRWYLTTFRQFEWNPSIYAIAGPLDFILNTPYAAKPQRLRTLLKRIAHVPAYYQAAQANITGATREHTGLAIAQAPGNLLVLGELEKAAQESILTPAEKQLFAQRIGAARAAVDGYVTFLKGLEKTLAADPGARSFRIGRELYEAKFAHDIASSGTAEQNYQKALAAREQVLQRMNDLADELWAKTMGEAARPEERTRKIGMVIDKLSGIHVTREELIPEIRRQVAQLQDFVARHDLLKVDPKKQLVVREMPLYQRGVVGAGIEAPGPYRPQDRTFYNVTPLDGATAEQAEGSLREFNHWTLQILNMHEAIPGHYTQLVHANKSASLVKSLFPNGAMVEGWAVYSERMMLEAGYGENTPEMWLMYSKWSLRSITNTILDYSVHVLGMSQAEAIALLTRQAFQSEREAAEKWYRVQVTSVQLASYFSGYSDIMALREQRMLAQGANFALKDFHEQFLSYGSAPVRMIRELMQ